MSDILIQAEHVSKKFAKDLKKSLYYGLADVFGGVIRKSGQKVLRKDEFWAVRDVSFEVRRGECLGLIGHNGAGKSTLLKMLNGLIAPDEGTITMQGRVGALIELGAGFNPILTGRENIYNNAAVIGFSKKEIDAKFESIVAFSEIGDFIDTPVKNYSSGMKVRLGFAVAAQLEPDVLIIDEVLAVGDLGFRVKCINRIQELLKRSAVIFVSHSMAQVTTVCTDLVLLNKGKIEYKGSDIGAGVEQYFMKFDTGDQQVIRTREVYVNAATIESADESGDREAPGNFVQIEHGGRIRILVKLQVEQAIRHLKLRLGIFNIEYRLLAEIDTENEGIEVNNQNGHVEFSVEIGPLFLRYGKYSVHLHVMDLDTQERLLRQSDLVTFLIRQSIPIGADFLLPANWKLNQSS
ncbi:MAG: ATP-binding cassette domain-containing protein [Chitinophagaceae bacterium]|nr:ATP-binding cassette domain-containing protein [Chitinophagaceae bacterium]